MYKIAWVVFFGIWAAAIAVVTYNYGILQGLPLLLSGAAVVLVIQDSARSKSLGCVFGLLAEPIWVINGIKAGQIGQVLTAAFFILAWARGIWINRRKSESDLPKTAAGS